MEAAGELYHMYATPGQVVDRQVGGKGRDMRVRKGARRERREAAVPSIPSKHPRGAVEGGHTAAQDGFSCRTTRFPFAHEESDLPGPGAYFHPLPFELHSDSLSKKGYGAGFVSKDRRFRSAPPTRGPGPGSYEAPPLLLSRRAQSRTAPSAAFAAPLGDKGPPLPTRQGREDTPGPGDYEPADPCKAQRAVSCHSAFWSRSHRNPSDKATCSTHSTPAPGEYEPMHGMGEIALASAIAAGERITWGGEALPSSFFRSTTSRGGFITTPKVPPDHKAGQLPAVALEGSARDIAREHSTPGPGAYTRELVECRDKSPSLSGRGSSMFIRSNQDRFGRALEPSVQRSYSPGPGAYHKQASFGSGKGNVARAAFASSAMQCELERRLNWPGRTMPSAPACHVQRQRDKRPTPHANPRQLRD